MLKIRLYLLYISALLINPSLHSQQLIEVSGRVINIENSIPVSNHQVNIYADEEHFLTSLYTNENGIFSDSLNVQGIQISSLKFETLNCKDTYQDTVVHSLNQPVYVEFYICVDSSQEACQANFEAFPDSTNQLKYEFFNYSSGDFENVLWEFGDGTTSTENNPEHTYDSAGTYQVCLSISSEEDCHDQSCHTITIMNTGCQAYFEAVLSPADSMTFSFTDMSTGAYENTFWTFGDGNSSDEENPVHTYAYPGHYNVCLNIYSNDSLGNCSDTYCDTVVTGNPVSCLADFSYYLDSTSLQTDLYHFYDQSSGNINSWTWDFGDGSFSTIKNPVHQYNENGTYEVCLTVTNTQTPNLCSDQTCSELQTPDFYNLGGLTYTGEYPMNNPVNQGDTAIAYLYRLSANEVTQVASRQFYESGYFWFVGLLPGNYIVKVTLTPSSTHFGSYFFTYHENAVSWESAETIQIADSNYFSADIHLRQIPVSIAGPGIIKGYVQYDTDQEEHPLPIDETSVILMNEGGNPLAFTRPEANGYFEFDNLKYGTYQLKADLTGKASYKVIITISANSPVISNVNLNILNTAAYGINDPKNITSAEFLIYPNPVSDILKIESTFKLNAAYYYEIRDIAGRLIQGGGLQHKNGENIFTISVSSLQRGIYLIRVLNSEAAISWTGKFVK